MTQTELQKKMQAEINRLGEMSYETLIKIQVRVQKISKIYSSLKTIKTQIASSDYGLLYEVYFMTLATQNDWEEKRDFVLVNFAPSPAAPDTSPNTHTRSIFVGKFRIVCNKRPNAQSRFF